MTVQHEHPTTTSSPARLPEPRVGHHDVQVTPRPAAAAPRVGAWSSPEDRTICRWLLLGMTVLSLYASVFVYLGTRVWS